MEKNRIEERLENEELLVLIFDLLEYVKTETSDNYRGQISLSRVALSPIIEAYMKQLHSLDDERASEVDVYASHLSVRLEGGRQSPGSGLMVEVTPVEMICNQLLGNLEFDDDY